MSEKKADLSKGMPRREFIKSTAIAGAGLVIASPFVRAQSRGRQQKVWGPNTLNIGIIGCGAQGQVLINALLKGIEDVRISAVCDIWEEYNQTRVYRLLMAYGHNPNKYIDYREMLDKEKDLHGVIIATPDFRHAEHAIAAMEAGLHVYCEKEMSNTLENARKMVQTQKRTGKLLQIGHQRRSNPRYIHCYEKLIKEANLLGRITTINGQWNRSVQPDNGWPEKQAIPQERLKQFGFKNMHQFRNWRWYKGMGGGPIVDLGSHQLDIYAWFLEAEPISVMASGGTDYYEKDTHEWYDTVQTMFEFKTKQGNIVRATYQTITTNNNEGYFEAFLGDEGALIISESAARGGVYRQQNAPLWDQWVEKGYIHAPEEKKPKNTDVVLDVRETLAPPVHEIPVEFNDPYHQPHLRNFFNAIRGEEELNCPAEVGYETAVMVLKVNEAVEAQRRLHFGDNEFKV
ncbi:MAG: Gfo/Idh/MocA family oxidoreductase [Deferribacteres bacterium]|nr:Gfo/Idh/MocA family oxidoreductase [candidate division KSB1 bacterium]MCB9501143.1 Gfo/Idh/MocA family oxidoreductase [Deferribacteres bacterium]